jgi:hypothetical protein
VPTTYSRVAIVNCARRVDLAVPGAAPPADVVPQLRRCAPGKRPEEAVPWTLGRLGGPNLSVTPRGRTRPSDGEVLERPR